MNNKTENTEVKDGGINITRSRRWLLKSSAGLTAAAMAAPMVIGSASAKAETVGKLVDMTTPGYDEYEMIGGI